MTRPLLLPIGFPLGYCFRPGAETWDPTTPLEAIRVGRESTMIDAPSYKLWEGAFEEHWREELTAWARGKVEVEVAPRLDQLVEDGLLAVVPVELDAIRAFFGRYQLVPTAIGTGNWEGPTDTFSIEGRGALDVNVVGYSIWAQSGRCQPVLEVIRELNRAWGRNEDELLLYFFGVLPDLLEEHVAVLDVP